MQRPAPVFADGRVSAEALLWRAGGRLCATVIVKAGVSLVPEGASVVTAPPPVARRDRLEEGARSIAAASDLAPHLARCDVTLVGHAWAPAGKQVQTASVRLAIARDGRTLLDKSLHVVGDRDRDGAPIPFAKMPLVYERAFGGAAVDDNPIGTVVPNLYDPLDARRPACFGPIPRFWKPRRRLLGSADASAFDAPVIELPEPPPWGFFQAAPRDQQIEHLRGDEWLLLEGLHPSVPRVRTRLPGATAKAWALERTASGAFTETPVDLSLDTLAIDADRMTCALVWRGSRLLASDDVRDRLRFLAALGEAAAEAPRAAQPKAPAAAAAAPVPAAPAPAPAPGGKRGRAAATVALTARDHATGAQKPVAPFAVSARAASQDPATTSVSATPWDRTGAPRPSAPPPGKGLAETMQLDAEPLPLPVPAPAPGGAAAFAAAPFGEGRLAGAPPPAAAVPAASPGDVLEDSGLGVRFLVQLAKGRRAAA